MTIDVNKIIMESIAAEKEEKPQANPINENTDASKNDDVKLENNQDNNQDYNEDNQTYTYSPISAAIPAAISAGLGALTLRNRLRNIDDGK